MPAYYDDDELAELMGRSPLAVTYTPLVCEDKRDPYCLEFNFERQTWAMVKAPEQIAPKPDTITSIWQSIVKDIYTTHAAAYAGARDSDCDGIAASLTQPKPQPATFAPVSRVKPAISGLDVVTGGDHRPGAWKAVR